MIGRRRSGVFTPVVLMVLAVFAILGVTYQWSGTSSYGQSAQVIYNLKAGMLAQAALEEAQAVIYDKVNRPERFPLTTEWKNELLQKVDEAVKAKESGTGPIIFRGADTNGWINLLTVTPGGVTKVKDLARDLSAEADITECKVKFYGFRKIPYTAQNSIYDKESYYSQDKLDEGATIWVPNDFIGYYTIKATAKSRGQTKTLSVTHDMKIVNVAPIGHEFALYQMRDKKDDGENSYYESDLNRGGPFRVFARGWGRVMMRGNYTVESEGLPGGEGGYGPFDKADDAGTKTISPFFVRPENYANGQKLAWDGWHVMPNPRAGIMKREGFVAARDQARPHTTPSGIVQTIVGGVTNAPIFSAGGSVYTRLGADPGLYIPENQTWYTGYKDTSNGKEFSLFGNPKEQADSLQGFSMFRGLRFRLEAGKNELIDAAPYWPIDDLGTMPVDKVGQTLFDPPNPIDGSWFISPEGNLKLKCRVVKFNHPGVNWADAIRLRNPFNLRYNLEPHDRDPHPQGIMSSQLYALHWEPIRTRGVLDSVLDAVKAITPVFMFYNPAFLLFGALDPRAFFSGAVPAGAEELKNGVPKKSLPLNFKGVYSRAATRIYQKANNIRSVKEARTGGNAAKMMLDGVIWARELKIEAPIDYLGKGILGSEPNPDVTSQDAIVTAPIKPSRDRIEESGANGSREADGNPAKNYKTNNYLTLVYQGASDNATSATQMVTVKSRDAVTLVDGTVFSTHGVKPDGGGKTLMLHGNYVCGLINKQKIADDSKVQVDYNAWLLGRRKGAPAGVGAPAPSPPGNVGADRFTKGEWHTLSVSPRVAGFFEK